MLYIKTYGYKDSNANYIIIDTPYSDTMKYINNYLVPEHKITDDTKEKIKNFIVTYELLS